ncbi:MAG: tetratricopeptide repeat protein [Acidobacteriia bacterium]|nr:tetratricopeptide repeat protein [Terriglobia bacterium]
MIRPSLSILSGWVLRAKRSAARLAGVCLLALPGSALAVAGAQENPAGAQGQRAQGAAQRAADDSAVVPGELEKRLGAARAARESGDWGAAAQANERVIALGLREMARVGLQEAAFARAEELYRRSLQFEESADAHVGLAIAYLYAQRPEDSLAEAEKALGSDPGNAQAWNLRGEALLKMKKYGEAAGEHGWLRVLLGRAYQEAGMQEEAAGELRRALALEPKTANAHYFLGLGALEGNEWAPSAESRSEFLQEVRLNPRHFQANYLLGFMAANARETEESDRYLKIAAEIRPSVPETWLYLGLNAYSRKENGAAEEYFRKAIALGESEGAQAHGEIRKAYISLGRILLSSGRAEEGERCLARARELQQQAMAESQEKLAGMQRPEGGLGEPAGERGAAVRGDANLTAGQKEQARRQEEYWRGVLGAGFHDLGTAEAMREEYAAALGHYREAEQWNAKIPGLARNLGFAAFRAGEYAEAVRALKQALEAAPEDKQARALLGLAYFASEAFAETVRTLAPLGKEAAREPELGYAWADALARSGEGQQAARVLEELERGPAGPDILLLAGELWSALGEDAHALATLRRALQGNPALKKAHLAAGQTLLRAGRAAEAAQEFQAELALAPDEAEARYNLAFAHAQQGQQEQARALFEEVLAAHPKYAEAHYQFGKMLLEAGKAREAIAHLEEAARLRPEAEEAHCQLQAAYRREARNAEAERELRICQELQARKREPAAAPGMPEKKP